MLAYMPTRDDVSDERRRARPHLRFSYLTFAEFRASRPRFLAARRRLTPIMMNSLDTRRRWSVGMVARTSAAIDEFRSEYFDPTPTTRAATFTSRAILKYCQDFLEELNRVAQRSE